MRIRRVKSNRRKSYEHYCNHADLHVAPVVQLRDYCHLRPARVRVEQVISADILAFSRERGEQLRPRRAWNALAPAPFDDRPMTLFQIDSHLGDGLPAAKNVLQGDSHSAHSVRDELSRQGVATFPAREKGISRENLPMGRAKSPLRFNQDLAARLKAARIAARHESAPAFAKLLGVEYERYKKWESGRTPIPHEYIPRACELTDKDANYFYGIGDQEARKAG